ncbi:hypothetical protein HX773_21325, partial [Pantoea sp. B9002]|uniref:Ig-like domain-containing protein n=1 Tax=Pantoea sp. B9002 TaxID=2726979 RepID=UPI0015A35D6E
EITAELDSGTHAVIARAGTQESSPFRITVEAAADVPVTIIQAYDNVGTAQYLNNGSGKTDDTRPTFSGTAGAGQLVTLFAGETALGSVRANASGRWSLEITAELASGTHVVTASTSSQSSSPFRITVEAAADVPVTIIQAYDNVGTAQYLNNGSGKTDDTRPTFSGTAGAGQLVTLFAGDTALGSVRANASGRWSLEITAELASGTHAVIARAGTQESSPFHITVEVASEVSVTIENAYDNVGHEQFLSSGMTTDDMRPTFYGSAAPGHIVTLYAGEIALGSVRAGANGRWSLEITTDLNIGDNNVIARSGSHESKAYVINVELPDVASVTIEMAYDRVGDTQYISSDSGFITDDTRPVFFGSADSNQIVTLYAGDTVLGSVKADYYGGWYLEITTDLPDGFNAIIARTEAGDSAPFTFTVEAASNVMTFAEVLIDSDISLFNEVFQAEIEEKLILAINEADWNFENQIVENHDAITPPISSLYKDEHNYLAAEL